MEFILAGGKLQRCRVAWLEHVCSARNILLVGEGHGRFLEVCACRFPSARLVCVDASVAMLRIAERRWRRAGGDPAAVEFVQAALPGWAAPKERFDLIVAHFFLDCFPPGQLAQVIQGLARSAAPQARWLVADFAVPEGGWRSWRASVILRLAYGFFHRFAGLPARRLASPDGLLEGAGFSLARRVRSEWGLLHSDLWIR